MTIGSDGTPYKQQKGAHRLIIAQHYQLASVPVKIVSIDYSWAKRHLRSRKGSLNALLQAAVDADERGTGPRA